MPVGTVKKLVNAINHLGTGSINDPLNKRAVNSTHANGTFRGCHLVCESEQKAKYAFSSQREYALTYFPNTIVEYDGELMHFSDAVALRGYDPQKLHFIDAAVCPSDGHEQFTVEQFANQVCPQFGTNATSGDGCAIAASACHGSAVAVHAPPSTNAALGAIAVIPIVGGLAALGVGAWCLYKYCTKRDNTKVGPEHHVPPKRQDAKLQLEDL